METRSAANVRLPDFLVIGAYKCGTTSLCHYLSGHDQIFLPHLQEPRFFALPDGVASRRKGRVPRVDRRDVYARRHAWTLEQYASLFAAAPRHSMAGECSPEYLRSSASAAPAIRDQIPDAKLLAILRNPVERAFSEYLHFVRDGLEQDTFEVAISRRQSLRPKHSYVLTGYYASQLASYLKRFPGEQLKIVLFDDLRDDPTRTLRDLFSWLGVDQPATLGASERLNPSGMPRGRLVAAAYRARRRLRPYVKPWFPRRVQTRIDRVLSQRLDRPVLRNETRRRLCAVYAEDVLLLDEITGRDLSGRWLRVR
ncbi:MAG: sulfotransferase [Nocardioidaceae bacterium]